MMLMWALVGCGVELDGFVFAGIPCSQVGPDTCDGSDWDGVCLTCEADYAWDRAYPWFDTMLAEGESVRPIDPSTVTRTLIPTADGEGVLDAYFVPSHGEDPALARTTIFYNHGNFASIEHYVPRIQVLHELGYNVFVWDYRGYGKSLPAHSPTPQQFMDDALLARVHVDGFAPDADKVVIYGYSLGALPAVEASLHRPGCALVLEAPFTSLRAIARSGTTVALPESYLSAGLFENPEKIRGYPGPLFAMVGEDDGRFAPDEVAKIVENAPGPSELWVLPGVEHGISNGGVVEAGMSAYGGRMREFIEERASGCF